jgi:hypothetical protein
MHESPGEYSESIGGGRYTEGVVPVAIIHSG